MSSQTDLVKCQREPQTSIYVAILLLQILTVTPTYTLGASTTSSIPNTVKLNKIKETNNLILPTNKVYEIIYGKSVNSLNNQENKILTNTTNKTNKTNKTMDNPPIDSDGNQTITKVTNHIDKWTNNKDLRLKPSNFTTKFHKLNKPSDLNHGVFVPRKGKGNRWLWPIGIAVAVMAASTLGIFVKIIWSVSMLSTIMSTASMLLSALFSLGKGHAHRRYETVPIAASYAAPMDQYYADKRADEAFTHDFTTEYSDQQKL